MGSRRGARDRGSSSEAVAPEEGHHDATRERNGLAQRMTMGVGAALRTVRTSRGLSVNDAARDTRIRREFLEAIEDEDFGRLLGDVHVRGCLRTYASYLRVSPDKVVAAYVATLPEAPPPPEITTAPPQTAPVLGARRRRDNHRLLVLIAATVLVLAAAFGVLSAGQPAPTPAELSSSTPSAVGVQTDRRITVAILARGAVEVTIVADDGDPAIFELEAGEGRSFEGRTTITVALSDGSAAEVTVSGGAPLDIPSGPWEDTFGFGASPSG